MDKRDACPAGARSDFTAPGQSDSGGNRRAAGGMAGGNSRDHLKRHKFLQDLNFTGLRTKFRDRRGQLCQRQKLARAALIVVQRARLIGMLRFVVATATRLLAASAVGVAMMLVAVAVRVVMMIVTRVLVCFVVVRFRRDHRCRAAGAEPVAVVVVSHPRQLRRQQVGGDERQNYSAVRAKHRVSPKTR